MTHLYKSLEFFLDHKCYSQGISPEEVAGVTCEIAAELALYTERPNDQRLYFLRTVMFRVRVVLINFSKNKREILTRTNFFSKTNHLCLTGTLGS